MICCSPEIDRICAHITAAYGQIRLVAILAAYDFQSGQRSAAA